MALIPVGFGQVNYVFSGIGAPTGAQVTCGFDHTEYTGTVQDMAEDFEAAWVSNIAEQTSSDVTLDSVLIKLGPNDLGPSTERASGYPGQNTPGTEPPNASVLVQKLTAVGGRQGRGRMYLPGPVTGVFGSDGVMMGGWLGDWQGALNDWFDYLVAADLHPVVLHGPTSVLPPLRLTEVVVSPRAATQRQRLRR